MSDYETLDLTRYIAGKIRALMAQHGVSQGQLAESVGVSQSQLSKMVRGTKPITIDQFDAMCGAFGIESWVILKDAENFLSDYDREIAAKVIFVEEGVLLPAPFVVPNNDIEPIVPVVTGRKKAPKSDVSGVVNDDESQYQRDQALAAKKRSKNRGEISYD